MAVDSKLLKQLKHKDPKERRRAIVALADCRDLAGVKPLEEAAKSDDEPKLREIAARAAKHLKEQMDKPVMPVEKSDEAYKGEQVVQVSEKQKARAREYLDEAMSMVVAKDNAKATKALAKALQADPAIKDDQYFLSMASSIFNTSNEEAVRKLISGD